MRGNGLGWIVVALIATGMYAADTERVKPDAAEAAKVLAEQRRRGEAASTLLGRAVRTFESEHFIVHTTFSDADGEKIPGMAEAAYERFVKALDARAGEFCWTGKVVVYVLAGGEEFMTFSREAHGVEGGTTAYFRASDAQAELVIPRNDTGDHFEQDLTHEATHVLLHFYRVPGSVPPWLHEGLAQTLEFQAFPKCRERTEAQERVKKGLEDNEAVGLVRLVKEARPASSSDLTGYAYSWSVVDNLLTSRPDEMRAFVRQLKDGTTQEEAVQKAFRTSLEALEAWWLKQVRKEK